MISTADIQNILFTDALELGVSDVYPKENVPEGDVTSERVVIIAGELKTDTYNNRAFCNVNIEIPDLDEFGNANLPRLEEMERMAQSLFKGVVGEYDGSVYQYTWDSINILKDDALHCHYVNTKILFKVLNIGL